MKIKTIAGRVVYGISKNMPVSYNTFGSISSFLRGIGASLLLKKCGKNVNIEKGAVFSPMCTIGDNSGIGINCKLGEVHIGNNVLMGPECIIFSHNHGFEKKEVLVLEQGYTEEKPVYIGNDVWLGERVIVMPGVVIADGTVIGAGSVVTKDTEEYSVVAGNPAKVVGMRK